jgi:hypothetical protein
MIRVVQGLVEVCNAFRKSLVIFISQI